MTTVTLQADTKARLDAVRGKDSFNAIIAQMLDDSENGQIALPSAVMELIEQGIAQTGLDQNMFIQTAIQSFMDSLEKKKNAVSSVEQKLVELVKNIMIVNESADYIIDGVNLDQTHINQRSLINLYKTEYGQEPNRKNVNNVLQAMQTEIDEHHKKVGIDSDHNRNVFNVKKRNGLLEG